MRETAVDPPRPAVRSAHARAGQERFLGKVALAANVILAAGAGASALVLGHFLYRYGWTAERRFDSWPIMFVHYLAPAALAIVLAAALRLERERRIDLALACVVVVCSLYAGELVLHFVGPTLRSAGLPVMEELRRSDHRRQLAASLEKQFGVPIDPRTGLEVVADLRVKGVEAVRTVLPSLQLHVHEPAAGVAGSAKTPPIFALGGISDALTLLCNESSQTITYRSDEHGFRNPPGLWPSAHVDIVAVGDSFTQGYCAGPGSYFVDLIREDYHATLNLGMSGNGPLLELATLREYVPALRPRLVLWFYFEGNDLLDLRAEQHSALLMRYLEDGFRQELSHRQGEVDRAFVEFMKKEEIWEAGLREAKIRNRRGVVGQVIDFVALPRLRTRLGLLTGRSKKESDLATALEDLRLFRQVLSSARSTVASWGGTLDFVYLPVAARFLPQYAFDRRLAERHHEKVLRVAADLGIPIIDVLPAFEAQPDPISLFPFRGPGHYAEGGHRLVAEKVLKAITRSGILRNRGVIADAGDTRWRATAWSAMAAPEPAPVAIDRRKRPVRG